MRSLAQRLGVSVATISRVLAGQPQVSDHVRARVLAAAAAAGLASTSAGAQNGRRLLAIVNRSWTSGDLAPSFADLLHGAAQGARQVGASIDLLTFEADSRPNPSEIRQRHASALLFCHWFDLAAATTLSARLPSVVIGNPLADGGSLRRVSFDAAEGVVRLYEHLWKLGHRRIAFVSDSASGWKGSERAGAALAATLHHEVPCTILRIDGLHGWTSIHQAVQQGITGLIADSQKVGQQLLQRLAEWSVDVPRQVSVCSFTFTPTPAGCLRLTAMRGDWQAVGRIAARLALSRPDQLDPGLRLLVTSQVEEGETTGPVRPVRVNPGPATYRRHGAIVQAVNLS